MYALLSPVARSSRGPPRESRNSFVTRAQPKPGELTLAHQDSKCRILRVLIEAIFNRDRVRFFCFRYASGEICRQIHRGLKSLETLVEPRGFEPLTSAVRLLAAWPGSVAPPLADWRFRPGTQNQIATLRPCTSNSIIAMLRVRFRDKGSRARRMARAGPALVAGAFFVSAPRARYGRASSRFLAGIEAERPRSHA